MSEPNGTAGTSVVRPDLHDHDQRLRLQHALENIPGVMAVRIVPGYDRPIDELHALVTLERAPKQVVRDVQSLLFTRFDLNIDHRVISVVQLDEDDPIVVDDGPAPARTALTSVSVTQATGATSVSVVITDRDDRPHVGEATDQPSVSGLRAAAAEATLHALRDLLGDGTSVVLQALRMVDGGGQDVALAVISTRMNRAEMLLTGSAVVRRGEADAIARAILDALNRILQYAA